MGIIKKTILDCFDKLQSNFTLRAFVVLLFGAVLLFINLVLFIMPTIYLIRNFSIGSVFLILFGLIGLLFSCFLIFYISLYNSVTPVSERETASGGSSLLSSALAHQGKGRKKKIAIAVSVYVAIWLVGIAALGYYFIDNAQYSHYVETTAVVVDYKQRGDDYSKVYQYTVDGTTYTVTGHVKSESIPTIGEKVVIKYDPNYPSQIYLQSEKLFFVIFGSFFIFCGLLLVLYELYARGFVSMQFFVALVLLGITAVVLLATTLGTQYDNIITYLAQNMWMHLVLIFTNIGLIMLMEGILDFAPLKRRRSKRKVK